MVLRYLGGQARSLYLEAQKAAEAGSQDLKVAERKETRMILRHIAIGFFFVQYVGGESYYWTLSYCFGWKRMLGGFKPQKAR